MEAVRSVLSPDGRSDDSGEQYGEEERTQSESLHGVGYRARAMSADVDRRVLHRRTVQRAEFVMSARPRARYMRSGSAEPDTKEERCRRSNVELACHSYPTTRGTSPTGPCHRCRYIRKTTLGRCLGTIQMFRESSGCQASSRSQ